MGCALTSGGYLGLGLLALFEFCLVLPVFLLSSHISFTICRVTKASGRGCGASWTATQLHRVRGLDERRPAAASRGPTTLSWTSGWSATSCCGPPSTRPAPTTTRNFLVVFVSIIINFHFVFCAYLLCFVVKCTDCHDAESEPGPRQCILMGDLRIPGRLFLARAQK